MAEGPNAGHVSPPVAFAVATISIAFFSAMDAVMKGLTIKIGVYDTVLWRALFGAAIASFFFYGGRMRMPERPVLRLHLDRKSVV